MSLSGRPWVSPVYYAVAGAAEELTGVELDQRDRRQTVAIQTHEGT